MNRLISFGNLSFLVLGLGFWSGAAAQTCLTLDYPGGVNTQADGIAGNLVIGEYDDPSRQLTTYGYFYNLSTATYVRTFGNPLAGAGYGTFPNSISGNNIVGSYDDSAHQQHGFVYNLSTSAYTTLDDPLTVSGDFGTFATGISGNNVVGGYNGSSDSFHGFVYNLSTSAYTTLDDPNAAQNQSVKGTAAEAISGNNVVGIYYDSADHGHSFLYNLSTKTYTTLDDPLAGTYTGATGIDGNTVFGKYFDTSNNTCLFEYNIATATYTTLENDTPGYIWNTGGISGNTIVGTYTDSQDLGHGFVITLPEPSTFTLLGVGAVGLAVTHGDESKNESHSLGNQPFPRKMKQTARLFFPCHFVGQKQHERQRSRQTGHPARSAPTAMRSRFPVSQGRRGVRGMTIHAERPQVPPLVGPAVAFC